jgi:glycosyltransferase involved in cell wall biosynthesis
MTDRKPFFSIVVPIYNEERFIREALDSILAQTDLDWEALLVDDGSTDFTPQILDEYAITDSRFRVFHKINGGQSTAINKGVQEARGQWLCWLSGDDYFDPKKLELNRKWIQHYPGIKFFFTGFWLINPDGSKTAYSLDWLNLENPNYHLISLLRANYVMGISICVERESWRRNGGFDETLRYAHDLDMWLRLMLNTPTKYLPDRTCTMRNHAGQESARFPLAGLFDSSKSAIRLINAHPFSDLFPNVDLNDHQTALDVLSHTLRFTACEPTSNYYMLGFHPLLQLRIMEWIFGEGMDPVFSKQLKKILYQCALEMESTHLKSQFGFLWKFIRIAVERAQLKIAYFPCEPNKVGELNYYWQQHMNTDVAQPLRTYLERFDGLSFEDASSEFKPGCQLVLLLPSDVSLDDPNLPVVENLKRFWLYFVKAGCSVILVGKSRHIFGLMDGVPFLGWNDTADEKKLILALGKLDTVVAFSKSERLKWTNAERSIAFDLTYQEDLGESPAVDLLQKIQASPRQVAVSNGDYPGGILLKMKYKIKHWRSRAKRLILKIFSGG